MPDVGIELGAACNAMRTRFRSSYRAQSEKLWKHDVQMHLRWPVMIQIMDLIDQFPCHMNEIFKSLYVHMNCVGLSSFMYLQHSYS